MVKRRTRIAVAAVTLAATAFLTVSAPANAQGGTDLDSLRLPENTGPVTVHPSLINAQGKITLSLRLSDPSVSEAVGEGAKQVGAKLSRAAQRELVNSIKAKQKTVSDKVKALGGTQLTAAQRSVNSVIVSVDAKQLRELAKIPGVTSITPLFDRSYDLGDTVPYIGAAALQSRNPSVTGAGIRVAVLDSGIDYTHARFGGAGTQAAYWAAYGTVVADPKSTTTDGLFPTSKVIGGFDFVGDTWPNGPLAPDPDPIDCGPAAIAPPCAGGHGTHVASIIAGNNGVAPGASLYAFKVCSSVSTSCSGVALIQGMEAALDPNGDGDISDAVDIVNMSLGSNYGQKEDDLSAASANAVRMGVVVVASAGNGADKPYITGSPATTPEVLSVAETQVPSSKAFVLRIDSPPAQAGINKNTNVVDWAPITTGFAGDVKYGSTAAQRVGCDPYPAGFFTGMVALIDRGTCAVSIKVDNAADAGAIGVLVANNAAGAAPSFSFGGPPTFDPQQTLIIGQEVGNKVKAGLASGTTHVTVDPADATPLVGSMVATSSRGPSPSYVAIKPEIGAPGASVSANAGGGTTESAFGGTSGAAPMVSGSAALVLQVHPTYSVNEVKAVLMNTAETNIFINPSTQPGVLAEISRIGAGEVRVDKAVDTKTSAWDTKANSAALSFGYVATDVDRVLTKQVRVRNYSNQSRTYNIATSFRYANDQASGAVTVSAPASITVPSTGTGTFTVTLTIHASLLPQFTLDGGPNGANGATLAPNEFDGYVTLTGGGDSVHLPWHVLPHRAANVSAPSKVKLSNNVGTLTLTNPAASGQAGTAEIFTLSGKSTKIPATELPDPGDNFAVVDLQAAGVRTIGSVLQFGVTTYGQRAHPNAPAEFDVLIDTNQDGTNDFVVFNADLTVGSTGQFDGRNVVFVGPIGGAASAFFFTDAALNSANAILTVPLSALGLSVGQTFDFSVLAGDNYFTGAVTDSIEGMTYQVGSPRFATSADTVSIPAGGSASVGITAIPSATEGDGLLLLMRHAEFNEEALTVLVS